MRETSIEQQSLEGLSHDFFNDMGAAFTDIDCLYLEVFLSGLERAFGRLRFNVGQKEIQQETFCDIIREAGLNVDDE
eukprot:scaffold14060_cov73-Skeletonema_marinoi.AAC.1